MPGIQYNQGEVILVPFPYSDLSSVKKRPVLIVSNNQYNNNFDDVIVCVITSSRYKDSYSIPLLNNDLVLGILPEESIVKVHKLFSISKSMIIKRFSIVNPEYYLKVESILNSLVASK